MTDNVNARRPYDSAGRRDQARARRQRALATALDLISTVGYPATTMQAVATGAGVSVEFLYKTFGDKPTLVKQLLDFAAGGDDEDIPVAGRPAVLAMIAEPHAPSVLRKYADMAGDINGRAGPLLLAVAGAANGDARLGEIWEVSTQQRLGGATALVANVAGKAALRLPTDRARDTVWTLTSPEIHSLLVRSRGWSTADYTDWLADSLCRMVLSNQ